MNAPLPYRSGTLRFVPAWRRSWPLARWEFLSLFRTRWGVAAFLAALLPGIVRLVMLLILFGVLDFGSGALRNRIGRRGDLASLDPERVEFYLEPVLSVMPGMVFALVLSSLVSARGIARDRVTNALELYWTRGISPRAYLLAKWLGGWGILACTTVGVPLLLWVTATLLADDASRFVEQTPRLALSLAGLLVVTGALTGICTLVSAASSAPNAAIVVWSMLLVGSSAVGLVLARALATPWLASTIGIWSAGGVVVRAVAGIPQRGVSVVGSVVVLCSALLIAWFFACRRLRLAEAVA